MRKKSLKKKGLQPGTKRKSNRKSMWQMREKMGQKCNKGVETGGIPWRIKKCKLRVWEQGRTEGGGVLVKHAAGKKRWGGKEEARGGGVWEEGKFARFIKTLSQKTKRLTVTNNSKTQNRKKTVLQITVTTEKLTHVKA